MSYFAQYSYLRQLSFHADKYACSYIQMNSGRYPKISYLLWATDYPRQWSDFICWSILSVQSHKTSNYRICFYYLESWRLRSQLQLYDGKNALIEKKKKRQYKQCDGQTSSKCSRIIQNKSSEGQQPKNEEVLQHHTGPWYRAAALWIQSCEQPLDIVE